MFSPKQIDEFTTMLHEAMQQLLKEDPEMVFAAMKSYSIKEKHNIK